VFAHLIRHDEGNRDDLGNSRELSYWIVGAANLVHRRNTVAIE
jgi:hypothetical protein